MNAGVCTLQEARDIARQLFDQYDKNRNGIIDQNEAADMILDAYKAMGSQYNRRDTDAQEYAAVLDENQDNRVTYEDVEAFAIRILVGGGNFMRGQMTSSKYTFENEGFSAQRSFQPQMVNAPMSNTQFADNFNDNFASQTKFGQETLFQEEMKPFNQMVQTHLDVVRRLFKKYDKNNSNTITENEQYVFEKVFQLLADTNQLMKNPNQPTQEDVKAWMLLNDTDRDGKVTLDEYEKSVLKSLEDAGISLYD